ncbi:uncharacterized protein AKAME5_002035200 [Lates japonicus]|uniref:Uncharacterized protein n=1 Tax=Lates japonicus TaxID=270547 RepID=A0AAD3NBI2_LATJO|nr:uncharacterized protein AKAME5_002035200 [Lates japonicus]
MKQESANDNRGRDPYIKSLLLMFVSTSLQSCDRERMKRKQQHSGVRLRPSDTLSGVSKMTCEEDWVSLSEDQVNLEEVLQELRGLIPDQLYSSAEHLVNDMNKIPENSEHLVDLDCYIIIVFCPITSRVGSDVEAALRREEVSQSQKPVILVMMHHTREVDYSPDGRKWCEKYRNVVSEALDLWAPQSEPQLENMAAESGEQIKSTCQSRARDACCL